jgi:arginase family enzyme
MAVKLIDEFKQMSRPERQHVPGLRLGPEALAQSTQQLDLIVVEMQQVLSQMLELETFNEAIALLRSIMESQQQINEKTKQQRRKLLED